MIKQMKFEDLDKLQSLLAEAVQVFMKYKQGDEKPLEIANRDEMVRDLVFAGIAVFQELAKRVKADKDKAE